MSPPFRLLACLALAGCMDPDELSDTTQAETQTGPVTTLTCPGVSLASCLDPVFPTTVCGSSPGAKQLCASLCPSAPPPTKAQCEDPSYLSSACGQIEVARWSTAIGAGSTAGSTCASLKAVVTDQRVGFSVVPAGRFNGISSDTLLPRVVAKGDGTTTTNPWRTHDTTLKVPFTNPRMRHLGDASTYAGWREHEATRTASSNPVISRPDPAFIKALKDSWDANGNRVASCKEYVYEKYYNYSKYQDAVEARGNNFRAYVDAAFAAPTTLTFPALAFTPVEALGVEDDQQRLTTSQTAIVTSGSQSLALTKVQKLTRGGGSQVTIYPASAIGSLGEQGVPIRARDGSIVQRQINLDTEPGYKSIFFAMPAYGYTEGSSHVLSDDGDTLDPCGSSIFGLNICDENLREAINKGHPISIARDWKYHRAKSANLKAAGITDEDLYLADQLKARYQRLLDEHLEAVHAISAMMTSAKAKGLVAETTQLPGLPINSYPGHALEQQLRMAARQSVDGLLGAQTATTPISTFSSLGGTTFSSLASAPVNAPIHIDTRSVLAPTFPHAAQKYGAVEGDTIAIAGALLPDITQLGDLDRLRWRLATVDQRIEATLLEARDMGCLAVDPAQPVDANPCDWSPRDFAVQVTDFYMPEQEADYARCLAKTQSVGFDALGVGRVIGMPFEPEPGQTSIALPEDHPKVHGVISGGLAIPMIRAGATTAACYLDAKGELLPDSEIDSGDGLRTAVGDQPFCADCNVWSRSTSRLDTYFQCLDAFGKLVFAVVEDKVGDILDETGRPRIGNSKGDSTSKGNDDWNMHASYGFGWSAGNFDSYVKSGNSCDLAPEAYGQIAVGATAFGHAYEIFSASGHGRTGAPSISNLPVTPDTIKVDIEVLGKSLLSVDESTQAGGAFHPIAESQGDSKDFISITVPFALGPIPMSLTGGVVGRVGVDYGMHELGSATGDCAGHGLEAYFTPYAGIDGFAAVGLDLGVAAAGVKIALTIIEARFPFTASVKLKDVGGHPGIGMDTNLDLSLSTLGGRFSVYLRILFWTAEWTLFSWEGFHRDLNLFSTELDVPLEPLADATANLGL